MPRARIPVLIFLFQLLLHPLGFLGSSRSGKSLKHSSLIFLSSSLQKDRENTLNICIPSNTGHCAAVYFDIKKMQKKLISVLCNNWLHLTVTHGSLQKLYRSTRFVESKSTFETVLSSVLLINVRAYRSAKELWLECRLRYFIFFSSLFFLLILSSFFYPLSLALSLGSHTHEKEA